MYGTARTNYVKINDPDGLEKALEPFNIQTEEDDNGNIAFLVVKKNEGAFPRLGIPKDTRMRNFYSKSMYVRSWLVIRC